MLRLCDIYLNPAMLTIATISGLLRKFHGETKQNTGFRAKGVLVGASNWIFLTIRSLYGQSLVGLAL